jgi:hypothetical protein
MSIIKQFQGIPKQNKYILSAIIDTAGNMLVAENGSIDYIKNIPEHFQRLDQFSYGQKFIIDTTISSKFGGAGMKDKFTYILDDSHVHEPIKVGKFATRYRKSDIVRIMRNHEMFKLEQLFFVGDSEFCKFVLPYIDIVMLTVIDCDYTAELQERGCIIDKFPIEEYSKIFKTKKIDESEIAEINKRSASGLRPSNREISVISDYMTMVKTVKQPKGNKSMPYYKFVTFTE